MPFSSKTPLMVAALAGAAVCLGVQARAEPIAKPEWVEWPSGDDVADVYPISAIDQNLSGNVTLSCIAMTDGHLTDCHVTEESPPGAGFGQAALGLAPRFRMKPIRSDGLSVEGGVVVLPIRFQLPEAEAAPVDASVVSSVTEAPTPPRPNLASPHWIGKPSGADLARYYPRVAMRKHLSGGASISCVVDGDGRLRDCEVVEETPAEAGFGQAALSLSAYFRMSKTDGNGHSTKGGVVRVPIIFRAP